MRQQQVTIIGAGVGGLALAALLASKKKYNVTVIERNLAVGGKASRRRVGEFVYDEGPSILVLEEVYQDLFYKLGEPIEKWITLEKVPRPFRIHARGERPFYLGSTWEETHQNIHDWNADAAAELHSLHSKLTKFASILKLSYCDKAFRSWTDFLRMPLVASGLIVSPLQRYKTFVDRQISNPVLREFMYGFPGYAGFHPARSPASLALLPWSLLTKGTFYPKGGIHAIPDALFRYCTEHGVEFRLGETVVDFAFNNENVCEIITDRGTLKVQGSEKVVFNGCLGRFGSLLAQRNNHGFTQNGPLGKSSTAEAQYKNWAKQSPSFLTVQTSFQKHVSTAHQLAHHNLFLPGNLGDSYQNINEPGAPFPSDPPLYLNLPSVVDDHVAPKGHENAFLVVSVPSHLENQKESRKSEEVIAGLRYLNLLKAAIPEVAFGDVFVRGSTTIEDEFLQLGGQIYGPSLDHAQKLFGFARPGPFFSAHSNFALVGGSTQPGAGLPMVIQSAKIVAELLDP